MHDGQMPIHSDLARMAALDAGKFLDSLDA